MIRRRLIFLYDLQVSPLGSAFSLASPPHSPLLVLSYLSGLETLRELNQHLSLFVSLSRLSLPRPHQIYCDTICTQYNSPFPGVRVCEM